MANPTPELLALVDATASAEGVPAELLKGLVQTESNWDPQAYRFEPALNDASYGLTQTLYGTAKAMGYQGPANGLYIPSESLKWGARYLKKMLDTFGGNWALAAGAYNAGPGGMRRAISRTGSTDISKADSALPSVTRNYWKSVLTWARFFAGKITRADAIVQVKAGEITQELMDFANNPAGRATGFLLLAVALGALLILRSRNAG